MMGTPIKDCPYEVFHGYVCMVRGPRLYILKERNLLNLQGSTHGITQMSEFVVAVKNTATMKAGDIIKQRGPTFANVREIIRIFVKRGYK